MRRGTFITVENRNGRPWQAVGYVCRHEVSMAECRDCPDGPGVAQAMIDWWNNSFTQMQDRIVVRDRMINML